VYEFVIKKDASCYNTEGIFLAQHRPFIIYSLLLLNAMMFISIVFAGTFSFIVSIQVSYLIGKSFDIFPKSTIFSAFTLPAQIYINIF